MVYPRRDGSRSLATFVTLCAVTSCLFQGVAVAKVHRKQAPSVAASTCEAVSAGDAAAGILIVKDSSCATGGTGCIDTTCRFCKTKDTPKSSHFIECGKIGWTPAPGEAPPAVAASTPSAPIVAVPGVDTGCPYDVSPGDYSVGVQLVGDATCVKGGVGCFENICRYCKYRETPQSSHLTGCKNLGVDFSSPTALTTTAPTTSSPVFNPADIGDAPSTSSSTLVDTGCPYAVSEGDAAVGIQLVGDVTCVNGGVGCFADVCRFCKYRDTPQSKHLTACKDLGVDFGTQPTATTAAPTTTPSTSAPTTTPPTTAPPVPASPPSSIPTTAAPVSVPTTAPVSVPTTAPVSVPTTTPVSVPTTAPVPVSQAPGAHVVDASTGCPYPVSEGDFKVGIQLVGDATCAAGGVGCFKDVCRYCKFQETSQSSHLPSCGDFGYPRTEAPTFAPADIIEPVVDPSAGCAFPATEGDLKVGIQLVGDASCTNGGLGCFKDVCRYCQYRKTAQSGHLMLCKDLGFDFAADSDAPEPTTDAPVTASPVVPPVDSTTGCPYPVTDGDFAVGIQLVGDAECAAGGLGCYKSVCRYCKFQETPQSKHLLSCGAFGYPRTEAPTFAPVDIIDPEPTDDDGSNSAMPTETPDIYDGSNDDEVPEPTTTYDTAAPPADDTPTPPADDTPSPPADDTPSPPSDEVPNFGTGCPYPVSDGDLNVGIQLVGDASCIEGGLGCFKDVCRFCQFRKTSQSGHLMTCKGLGYDLGSGSDASEPTTDSPVLPPVDPATGCPYPVSEGDFAVGIQLVGDDTCAAGGLGCFKNICRYCKYQETPQSKHLLSCADFGYPRTEAPTFAPVDIIEPVVDPSTGCAFPVTEGDLKVGIQLVGDATCANGGLGCFKNVCRYCKFKETAQSGHLTSCKDLGFDFGVGSDASDPTTAAPVTTSPVGQTNCPLSVTEGDTAVGIQLLTDPSCASGGLGCVADVCRFCKFRDTPQSTHLLDCASFSSSKPAPSDGIPIGQPTDVTTDKCPFTASEGDLYIGVQIIEDTTCDIGGIGCFHDACRFCKFFDTDKSSHLEDCSAFGFNFEPIATTAAPRPGVATTPPPATPPPSDPVDPFGEVCGQSVSEGDKKVGIEMVTDASCLSGGVGCVADSVCRYCKAKETGANLHMLWCSTITGVAIDTPAPGAVDTPAPGAGDTPTPASGVTSEPTTATVTPGAGTATKCGQTVSEGDKNAGIDMITDATCIGGGVGCLPDSSCRFCKRSETAASGHLQWCPDIDIYATPAPAISTTAPAADVTIAPVVTTAAPVPAGPAVDASAPCDQALSEGDYNEGVGLATDPGCASGGLGCLPDSTCRYCKHWVTTASSHLDWCGGFDGYAPPPPTPVTAISATNTPAPTIDPTTCSTEVSAGDAEAGVAAVHDEQCVGGGIGCFGGVCRFCQVFETEQSANFLPCASMVTTVAPLRAAARVRAESTASTKNSLDNLFKDKTFKWSVVGAACVGVVAVVALFGLGAKRAVTRKGSRKSTLEEATADVETEKDVATVTAASPSDSDDAGLEEVHV